MDLQQPLLQEELCPPACTQVPHAKFKGDLEEDEWYQDEKQPSPHTCGETCCGPATAMTYQLKDGM